MTTKNFVVKNGITTGSITLDASSGNISGTNLSVTGVSNLGAVGNVKVTGGSANYVITTDGAGNLSFTDPTATQSPAPMPTYVAVGNTLTISSNYQGLFGYPITVDGTIVVDGILVDVNDATVPAGNINYVQYNNGNTMGGDANFYYTAVNGTMTVKNETITGNSTIGNLVTSSTANLGSVSNVKITGGINGYYLQTDGAGTLSWAAGGGGGSGSPGGSNTQVQFNDAGTFGGNSAFTFNKTTGALIVTGNVTGGNLVTAGVVSATGNITGSFILGNGSQLTGISATTATTAGTVTTAAQPNITSTGTLTSLAVTGNISAGNVSATTFTGALSGAATSATTAGTVTTAAQPNITSTGTLTSLAVTGNISAGNVSATTFTGALSGAATTAGSVTTAAQGNITSVGTLTGLGVNGTITGVNITANTGVFTGNGSSLTALNASNVSSGTLAQARLANASVTLGSTALTLGSTVTTVAGLTSVTSTTFVGALTGAASSATTAGTVTTAAQPNITSTGTLTSVSVSGNATAGNLNTAGAVVASTLTSNVAIGTAPLIVTSTTRVANLNVNYANVADFISVAAGTGNNFLIFANAATGNITELTSTGLTANLSNNSITATTFVGALSGAATSATTAGTVTTAAQPNITSVGTLTSISVSGNANIGNIGTAGLITATGNITGSNVIVTGYHFRSVGTSISAAGSTQGTATAISKEINVVSTVASGAGVVLPTAVAGMAITITNTSANSLLVYPATSGIINSLSANAGYTQPAGATLQFVAPTTTQWYTIGATYV